jgi:hypothetical protein
MLPRIPLKFNQSLLNQDRHCVKLVEKLSLHSSWPNHPRKDMLFLVNLFSDFLLSVRLSSGLKNSFAGSIRPAQTCGRHPETIARRFLD